MITYDGLRVLMMAEDDSRYCFWRKPALTPTKNHENKTVPSTVKISRIITRKSENSEILNFLKVGFSKINEKRI